MTKAEVRAYCKEKRKSLHLEERSILENNLMQHFLQLPQVIEAEWIYPFVSYGTEADTQNLIVKLLSQGKALAVPKVTGDEMEFVAITSFDELQPGTMGILEPTTNCVVPAKDGVMIMPGLGFDLSGMRVGYGAGFYDKYLAKNSNSRDSLYCLGYGFDFQLLEHIEGEKHDQLLDGIVTDKGFVACTK